MTKLLLLLHSSLTISVFSTSECCFCLNIFPRRTNDKILNSFDRGIRLKLCSPWIFPRQVKNWRRLLGSIFFWSSFVAFFCFWQKSDLTVIFVSLSKFKLIWPWSIAWETFWCKNIDATLNIGRAYLVQFFSNFVIEKVLWKSSSMIPMKALDHKTNAFEAFK